MRDLADFVADELTARALTDTKVNARAFLIVRDVPASMAFGSTNAPC